MFFIPDMTCIVKNFIFIFMSTKSQLRLNQLVHYFRKEKCLSHQVYVYLKKVVTHSPPKLLITLQKPGANEISLNTQYIFLKRFNVGILILIKITIMFHSEVCRWRNVLQNLISCHWQNLPK